MRSRPRCLRLARLRAGLNALAETAATAALQSDTDADLIAASEHRAVFVAQSHDDLRARLESALATLTCAPQSGVAEGVYLGDGSERTRDEIAFVFGGAANPYPGMGRDLLLAFPTLTEALERDIGDFATAFGHAWIFPNASCSSSASPARVSSDATYLDQLLAASCLMQAHAVFTRQVLGIEAGAAIGYSLGESNALLAFGAWPVAGGMLHEVSRAPLFTTDLAGRHDAVRAFLRDQGELAAATLDEPWSTLTLFANADLVRKVLATEPLVFLTLINTDDECVVAGEPSAVLRVHARLGCNALAIPKAPAVHCAALSPVKDAYRTLHTRDVTAPAGVAFYGHGRGGSYDIGREACGDALLAQALNTVDFPTLIRRAYDDGRRVFVDHGPRGLCAGWITRILAGRPHVAVALDVRTRGALLQAFHASAALLASGVRLHVAALAAPSSPTVPVASTSEHYVTRALHDPLPRFTEPDVARPMPRAPALPSILAPRSARAPQPAFARAPANLPPAKSPSPVSPVSVLIEHAADIARVHQGFLAEQTRAHATFLDVRRAQVARLASLVGSGGLLLGADALSPAPSVVSSAASAASPPKLESRLPMFDSAALLRLASGKLSEVFGPLFARQDGFPRQVRMPMPPLLLCDRVVSIDAEPGVLVPHTSIVTETDVPWDAWYLHEGRVPPSVLIEAGQADLLLISYMGVDFENRGERVYRLLGCDLTYTSDLPRAGQTLHYDIHIDGFASHGDTRIFFFHSDCRLGGPSGPIVLRVRNGQAGFFRDDELRTSGGVLWAPEKDAAKVEALATTAPPLSPRAMTLSRSSLEALTRGETYVCFGEGYEAARTHVASPRLQGGRFLLIDRVTELDGAGGPWRRGYVRAELALSPESWFFEGHFKDDPCMPGTIMFQGCLQCVEVLMIAMGFSLSRDGHRFQPRAGSEAQLRCRGQATPSSTTLVYEVFVKRISTDPVPCITADILVTIDGLKGLHCCDVDLELAVDWPLARRPDLLGLLPRDSSVDAVGGIGRDVGPVVFDQTSLLATGIGKPSDAFGPMYAPFDHGRRVPRLPGPPYHFMSRVTEVTGAALGVMKSGGTAVVAYDVPRDAWFFEESGNGRMPFGVLLEVALQPCGWLSSYAGSALLSDRPLFYRNLDGQGTLHAEVAPDVGTLVTRASLTNVARSGDMTIHTFALEVTTSEGARVFSATTVFGFFPAEALATQLGVGSADEQSRAESQNERAVRSSLEVMLTRSSHDTYALRDTLKLPGPMLCMIDRITDYWPNGGAGGLGRVRAEKIVNPDEWFFKAHFFEDPVQPGSLGLEAMIHTIQWLMIQRGQGDGLERPRFESLAVGDDAKVIWKYRGQVVPKNRRIVIDVDVCASSAREVRARAALWVDGLRIYVAENVTVRVVDDAPAKTR
jgi:3-hydroxymyristoyl/3-hydroxydecanoyl-(acyl carrier protein) dehydratase/malonyl CoA-acyl carrier protein transacylase